LAAALVKISLPISQTINEKAIAEAIPVDAIEFLNKARPAGPIFNSYNWGGYLIWELAQYPVFVDGRTDLYDDIFLREYLSTVFGQDGWEQTLDRYGINLVLIESQSLMGRLLTERTAWELIYQDEMATIFVRK